MTEHFLYGSRFVRARSDASISATRSSSDRGLSASPGAIAGVTRRD